MRLGAGVEWTAHCLLALAALPAGRSAPAERLAELHRLSPSYLAKHLQTLARAGLVNGGQGRGGGYTLARPAAEITLLDVVEAAEGNDPIFRCTEIRSQGPFPAPPAIVAQRCGIAAVFDRAERAWRDELATVTIAELAAPLTGPVARPAIRWLSQQEDDP